MFYQYFDLHYYFDRIFYIFIFALLLKTILTLLFFNNLNNFNV